MRSRRERVSEDFAKYLEHLKAQVEKDTGKPLSKVQLTSVIANIRPSLQMPIVKRARRTGSFFDL